MVFGRDAIVKLKTLAEPEISERRQNSKLKTCQRGYTLIELLVSVAIIIVLASVVSPSLNQIGQAQKLQNTAIELKAKVLEAQSLAMAPPTNTSGASQTPTAYGIEIYNDAGNELNYQLKQLLGGAAQDYPSGATVVTVPNITRYSTSPSNIQTIWFVIGYQPKVQISTSSTPISLIDPSVNPSVTLRLIANASESRAITVNTTTGAVDVSQ